MKIRFSVLKKISLATVAGIGLASIMPHPCLANSTADPLQQLVPQNNDPLAPRSDELSNMGMLDIINRLQMGTQTWNYTQQNQELDSAAAAFKARQQQLLQKNQPQGQIIAPSTVFTRPR